MIRLDFVTLTGSPVLNFESRGASSPIIVLQVSELHLEVKP